MDVPQEFLRMDEQARNSHTGSFRDLSWPELDDKALHGLPGEIVREVLPHTEADKAALLSSLLAACGNAMGRGAHMRVGADRHYLNLNLGLVGETSKGRKGMSWNFIRELVCAADPAWAEAYYGRPVKRRGSDLRCARS